MPALPSIAPEDFVVGLVVVDDQNPDIFQVLSQFLLDGGGPTSLLLFASPPQNKKVVPSPFSGLRPDMSPHQAAIFRQIDKPRPVPPYFLVVVPSACLKASKIVSHLSSAMPIPVSLTFAEQSNGLCRLFLHFKTEFQLSLFGKFGGIAEKIDEDLAKFPRIALNTVPGDCHRCDRVPQ